MSRRAELVRPLAEAQMQIIGKARAVASAWALRGEPVGDAVLGCAIADLKNAIQTLDDEFLRAVDRVSADLDRPDGA